MIFSSVARRAVLSLALSGGMMGGIFATHPSDPSHAPRAAPQAALAKWQMRHIMKVAQEAGGPNPLAPNLLTDHARECYARTQNYQAALESIAVMRTVLAQFERMHEIRRASPELGSFQGESHQNVLETPFVKNTAWPFLTAQWHRVSAEYDLESYVAVQNLKEMFQDRAQQGMIARALSDNLSHQKRLSQETGYWLRDFAGEKALHIAANLNQAQISSVVQLAHDVYDVLCAGGIQEPARLWDRVQADYDHWLAILQAREYRLFALREFNLAEGEGIGAHPAQETSSNASEAGGDAMSTQPLHSERDDLSGVGALSSQASASSSDSTSSSESDSSSDDAAA